MPDKSKILELLEIGIRRIISTCCTDDISPFEADSSIAVHRHQQREFIFVLEGENDIVIDGRSYHMAPGSLALFEPWQMHSNRYRKCDRRMIHLWGYVKPKQININMHQLSFPDGNSQVAQLAAVKGPSCALFNQRWAMMREKAPVGPELKELLLHRSLDIILEELKITLADMALVSRDKQKMIDFLMNHIREQLGRDCSLKQLEKISGYSQYYLSHLFREVTGASIGDYIDEVRMGYAAEAMAAGRSSKEIAGELGFASYGSYWKWQKKYRARKVV